MPARKQFTLYRCTKTGRRSGVKGCHCIPCDWRRSYSRQLQRDQMTRPEERERRRNYHLARARARCPAYLRRLERLQAWNAKQNPFAKRMYDQLVRLARRDGLWTAP